MHKNEVQQRQQWTTIIGIVCQNTSCGGDLDNVVQNCEVMAIATTCTRQENNINAFGSLDNANMPSLLRDTPQNIKARYLIIIFRPLYK
jgi:hypothetical protein